MSNQPSYLSYQFKQSRSAAIKKRLNYPVIDTDIHTIEYSPLLEEYIEKIGGSSSVDQYRAALSRGFGYLGNAWYDQSWDERRSKRSTRPPWWALPTWNTLDLATVSLPALLYERLQESGTDFGVLYPNVSTFAPHIGNEELRRVVVRAVNTYNADIFRDYADRLTPVAAIPLHNPQEGIEELEFAVKELGLKVALIPGYVNRPIKEIADKYPRDQHPELAPNSFWVDTYGLDSEHDYDPFWAKAVELGTVLTTHSAGMGWTARRSYSNYMYNHIGHFADASHALAKSLFFGGVTRRFPKLRVGLLEGGAAWGANLFADLVGHWEKRNGRDIQNYNPANIDKAALLDLFNQYGGKQTRGKTLDDAEALAGGALGRANNFREQDPARLDDFAAAGIEKAEDIIDRFVPNFYFGAEADDPTVAYAFNTRVNPFGVQLNAFWASDSGHWDVPDLTDVLADTWSLVERGALTEENFRDLVSTNPLNFYGGANPDFFKGTAIDREVDRKQAA
ncbi:MAG: amidohydrolase [Proteobacteria bacterium]|nr:amidohydrolase [Pseudomonadota bacterium]